MVVVAVAAAVATVAVAAVATAAETVVVMAKTTAQMVKVQKAPKAGVTRTPILIPTLVAKPMKAGYPISSEISLTGIDRPSKILNCDEYQLISPTCIN